jgi:hypothetical protein
MALCPAGHQSQTTDYCDTCGAVMGGAPITPAAAASAASPSASLPVSSGAEASSGGSTAGGTCPQCGAARGGRFCEECGFDFELAELVPPAAQASAATAAKAPDPAATQELKPDPLAQTAAMPPDYDFDAEFAKAEREFAASGGEAEASAPDLAAEPDANANAASTNAPAPANITATASPTPDTASQTPTTSGTGAPRQLTAVVIADPEYYSAQVERGDIVEDEFPFPKYPGERRFALDADRIRIGRASASRGIAVEIDLTGPPLDPAVSHLHAQLLRAPDGTWSVVDLDSANGTRVNGAEEPLPAETEVPVKAGDRIHVGVWTTLTLEEA